MKERLIRNIKNINGCWEWQGCKRPSGYGRLTVGSRTDGTRRTSSAHRESYKAFIGDIPDGLWVLHKCDNPCCINPDHLYLGDRSQNVADMVGRGRVKFSVGSSHINSKLTEADVFAIRKERIEMKTPYRAIAAKYGIKSHKTIIQICKGESWTHVELPSPPS